MVSLTLLRGSAYATYLDIEEAILQLAPQHHTLASIRSRNDKFKYSNAKKVPSTPTLQLLYDTFLSPSCQKFKKSSQLRHSICLPCTYPPDSPFQDP